MCVGDCFHLGNTFLVLRNLRCIFFVPQQMWFQNARDQESRKQTRAICTRTRKRSASSYSTSTSPSSYIPIVPNPYSVLHHHRRNNGSMNCKLFPPQFSYSNHAKATPPSSDQPLDLSVRKQQPPRAHEHPHSGQRPSTFLRGHRMQEDQALNLSNKVLKLESISMPPVKPESPDHSEVAQSQSSTGESVPKVPLKNLHSFTPLSIPNHQYFLHVPDLSSKQTPAAHSMVISELEHLEAFAKQVDASRIQQSEIYRYLTQKGLFKSGFPSLLNTPAHHKISPSILNPTVVAQIMGVIPPNNHHPQRDSPNKILTSADDLKTDSSKKNGKLNLNLKKKKKIIGKVLYSL